MLFCSRVHVASADDRALQVLVRREIYVMGTRAALAVWSSDRETGLRILEDGIQVLEETDRALSNWKADSLVSRLNAHPVGMPFELAPGFCHLFEEIRNWSGATRSAFDPSIGSLIGAWGIHKGGRWPSEQEIRTALERSGIDHYSFDRASCRITKKREVSLDSGAFGKGEALDRVRRRWQGSGAFSWMVDLGGQVMVQGQPAGSEGWRLDISHPRDRQIRFLDFSMVTGSLSTSAGSERDHSVGGRRVGHILDPRSGRPASFEGSVSVWHESALVADILSTALYVMGPDAGLKWAEARRIAACFLVPRSAGSEVTIRLSRAFQDGIRIKESRIQEYRNTGIRE